MSVWCNQQFTLVEGDELHVTGYRTEDSREFVNVRHGYGMITLSGDVGVLNELISQLVYLQDELGQTNE